MFLVALWEPFTVYSSPFAEILVDPFFHAEFSFEGLEHLV